MVDDARDSRHRNELGVVFVNYRSEHLIVPRATELRSAGFPVIVADNSGSLPVIEGVPIVNAGVNLGFGSACNLALRALPKRVRSVCFHNPDVHTDPRDLDMLDHLLRNQPSPGAVAPAERVGPLVRERGYHYPAALREAALGIRALVRRRPPTTIRHGVRAVRKRGSGARFPSGGLIVVDRSAHEAIRGFDEDYFLYVEDLDYWHRLRSGHDCWFTTDVVIRHDASTGSPLQATQRELLRWLGVELFAQKHWSDWHHLRASHRTLLPFASRLAPTLAAAIRSRWSQHLDPLTVMRQLRPALSAGRLWKQE